MCIHQIFHFLKNKQFFFFQSTKERYFIEAINKYKL